MPLTSHPEKLKISRPCPDCGGVLLRRTVNPHKPLGVVNCSNCHYTTTIANFAKTLQQTVKGPAAKRKAQG